MRKWVDKIKRVVCKVYKRYCFIHKYKGISNDVCVQNPENIICGKNCNIGKGSHLLCWNEYVHFDIKQKIDSFIHIGDNFNATRNLTIQSCGPLLIGNDVLIASDVFICNYDHGITNLGGSYLNNELYSMPTKIEDGVWIGDKAIVLKGVTIGKHAIIGAGAVVTKSIPPYSIAVGNPATVIKRYNFASKTWERVNDR